MRSPAALLQAIALSAVVHGAPRLFPARPPSPVTLTELESLLAEDGERRIDMVKVWARLGIDPERLLDP